MTSGIEILPESDEDALREADLCEDTARRMRKTCARMKQIRRRIETEPGYKPPWASPGGGGKGKRIVRYEEEG